VFLTVGPFGATHEKAYLRRWREKRRRARRGEVKMEVNVTPVSVVLKRVLRERVQSKSWLHQIKDRLSLGRHGRARQNGQGLWGCIGHVIMVFVYRQINRQSGRMLFPKQLCLTRVLEI
jgi:hypothetical protein